MFFKICNIPVFLSFNSTISWAWAWAFCYHRWKSGSITLSKKTVFKLHRNNFPNNPSKTISQSIILEIFAIYIKCSRNYCRLIIATSEYEIFGILSRTRAEWVLALSWARAKLSSSFIKIHERLAHLQYKVSFSLEFHCPRGCRISRDASFSPESRSVSFVARRTI